jgi:hypothetical protein
MSNTAVKLGDRVRHSTRPEWGVGTVIKVEQNAANGAYTPRVTVRFPNTGIKVLAALPIPLEIVTEENDEGTHDGEQTTALATAFESPDWLAPVAQKKAMQAMTSLPIAARDPFLSVRDRLKNTLDLYRFDRAGKLVDWAVAQTRMDDPLSRFTRHELEQYFDRWAAERDSHLARLHEEAKREAGMLEQVDDLLRNAPPAARHVLRQRNGGR